MFGFENSETKSKLPGNSLHINNRVENKSERFKSSLPVPNEIKLGEFGIRIDIQTNGIEWSVWK